MGYAPDDFEWASVVWGITFVLLSMSLSAKGNFTGIWFKTILSLGLKR